MTRLARVLVVGAFVAASSAIPASAFDPPDSAVNPVSGNIESVLIESSTSYVEHVIDAGPIGGRSSQSISNHAAENPRISITAQGDTWVVWWHDDTVDAVYARRRDGATGQWDAQKVASESGEESRYPEVAVDGETAWVGYQIATSSGTDIAALQIGEDPDPWGSRTLVAMTSATGDLDLLVHVESGHVWLTWVDDSSEVGWSEYDVSSEEWGDAQYESYSGGSVEGARGTIRDTVLGL